MFYQVYTIKRRIRCLYQLRKNSHEKKTHFIFDRKKNPTEVNPTEVNPTEVNPTEVNPTEVNPRFYIKELRI